MSSESSVGSIKLQVALLRATMPALELRPGAELAGRVAERQGKHGLLMLAGAALVAELPDTVKPGDKLRLAVQESNGEQVVLKIVDPTAAPAQPMVVPVPLPDGRTAAVYVEEQDSGGGDGEEDEPRGVTVVYDSPALGAIEFGLFLEGGGLSARIQAGIGAPHAAAEAAAAELSEAIAERTGRPVRVSVIPRRDPLDLYA